LGLLRNKVNAIVPAPLSRDELSRERSWEEPLPAIPLLGRWVRLGLVLIALGLVLLFGIAYYLDPYQGGVVWRQEAHTQLGLPECNFKGVTGLPCPSCGMSTSFALLVRGDVGNSLCANAVGTLLAAFFLVLLPWSVLCALRGRLYFVRAIEPTVLRLLLAFVTLMLLRWLVVLGEIWWTRA
jgi:uncharacterized protein DUF2752